MGCTLNWRDSPTFLCNVRQCWILPMMRNFFYACMDFFLKVLVSVSSCPVTIYPCEERITTFDHKFDQSLQPFLSLGCANPFLQPLLMPPALQPSLWLGGPPWPSAGCQCLSKWDNSTDIQNSGCGRVKSWHPWFAEHTFTHPAQGRVCPHPCCETAADLCSAFCSPALPKPHLSKQEPSLGHCLGLFHPTCKALYLLLLKLMLFLLTQSSSLLCFLFLRRLLSLLYVLSIPSLQLFIQILNTMCIYFATPN